MRLRFAPDGSLLTPTSPPIELPLPVILDVPAWPVECQHLAEARAMAARQLGTLAVVPVEECSALDPSLLSSVMPLFDQSAGWSSFDQAREQLGAVRMVQLTDSPQVTGMVHIFRESRPACRRLRTHEADPLERGADHRTGQAGGQGLRGGAPTSTAGRRWTTDGPDGTSRTPCGRCTAGWWRRASGTRSRSSCPAASHWPSIWPRPSSAGPTRWLWIRRSWWRWDAGCAATRAGAVCPTLAPARSPRVEPEYAAQRIVNLMGAWHSQLIEVLGAMGIREARRLRGETGRAIFMEDIEKEAFGDLCRVSEAQVRS